MPYEKFMNERLFQPLGMTDTTFWPSGQQVKRLAKSYRPNPQKTDLEETVVTQLHYPLADRSHRYPMPAGGLFSTASDTLKFCQMILNDGVSKGRRLLSEDAVRQMTRKQTGPDLKESYGLGFSVGSDGCGHGGAYATNMTIDRQRGLILIWMVQHAGFPGDGERSQAAFKQVALKLLGGGQ
jgi:CubicO group peptidase (beta-lactamase class C family)